MHLLIVAQGLRVTVTVPGTCTVYDLKEKVQDKTTPLDGRSTTPAWPVDTQEFIFNGKPLQDELTLAECGIVDRDRIELARREAAPKAEGGEWAGQWAGGGQSAALDAVIAALDKCANQLEEFSTKVGNRTFVHQELFTRLLEQLDGLSLDGLSDEEKTFVRGQRKMLVKDCEALSATAARIPKP